MQRGVPQGSVMGPTLYSLYSSPLEDLILANGFRCVIYADDTQLYSILKKDELSTVIQGSNLVYEISQTGPYLMIKGEVQ